MAKSFQELAESAASITHVLANDGLETDEVLTVLLLGISTLIHTTQQREPKAAFEEIMGDVVRKVREVWENVELVRKPRH
jgi:hypothetical protein